LIKWEAETPVFFLFLLAFRIDMRNEVLLIKHKKSERALEYQFSIIYQKELFPCWGAPWFEASPMQGTSRPTKASSHILLMCFGI
jgi:hypothetical protein